MERRPRSSECVGDFSVTDSFKVALVVAPLRSVVGDSPVILVLEPILLFVLSIESVIGSLLVTW